MIKVVEASKPRRIITTMLVILLCLGAGVAWAASGGGHGEEGSVGWQNTDWYKVLNFTVLVVGLFFVLRKPVANALNARIKGIEEQLSELETKKQAAEKELAAYDEKLAQLDKEAEKLMVDYTRQGEEAKARILEEAKQAAAKLEEQAKRTIETEYRNASAKLKQEALDHALDRAEELLKSKISAEDQERLVDQYLEKVVA